MLQDIICLTLYWSTDGVLASLCCVFWIRSGYGNNKVRTSFVLCVGFYVSDTAVSASINAVVVVMNKWCTKKQLFAKKAPIILRQLYLTSKTP